jgi:hypothetical protein
MNQTVTLDTLFNYMKDGFTDIKQDITVITKDFTDIKQDITVIKKEVTDLKERVTKIEKKLEKAEDTILGIKKYIKLESDFQEIECESFIEKIYLENNPSHTVTYVPIKHVFDYTDHEITELDGFLLISSFQHGPFKPLSNNLSGQFKDELKLESFREQLRNNSTSFNPLHRRLEYIFIEAKHSLNKAKIDLKIKQLHEIEVMLLYASTIPPNKKVSPKYITTINILMDKTHLPLNNLYLPQNLIFCSDDSSTTLREYINDIYTGSINKTYNTLTYKLFREDIYINDIIKNIIKDGDVYKPLKTELNNADTIQKLQTVFDKLFQNPKAEKYKKNKHLQSYLDPYEELAHLFTDMKGNIGVVHVNKIYHERLFPNKMIADEF